jgi:hypothetical protein
MAEACLKHSNLFKVNDPTAIPPLSEEGRQQQEDRRTTPGTHTCNHGGPGRSRQKSNYELFNCSNFNIRYWSWNYRGCWPFKYRSSQLYEHFLSQRRPSAGLCTRTTALTQLELPYGGISTFLKLAASVSSQPTPFRALRRL